MSAPNDTEPGLRAVRGGELAGPPRFLLWSLIILFVLFVVGIIAGVFIFRDVLQPAQQSRVIEALPFMRSFLPPTPQGGILPTVDPATLGSEDPFDLLNIQIGPTDEPEATAEAPADTPEPTPVAALPTFTPTPPPTQAPSSTPTPAPTSQVQNTAARVDAPAASGLPASARMFGFVHTQQTWNNCGPANITMALTYFGWTRDQAYAATYLKPNREDKNVSPHELVQFVNERTDVRALHRMGGDVTLLKRLIANNFPVIVETSAMFEAYDWIGHYRTLVAYDDTFGVFYIYDSFLGAGDNSQGVTESYNSLDEQWRAFNRTFIVIYQPENETLLRSLLGELADENRAAELAFEVAQNEARLNPQDAFTWFNMGTSLVALGRYQEAAAAYDQARRHELPWRMLWYQFGPFEAYYEVGRYEDVLALAQSNLNNAQELEESYYWRGRALLALGSPGQAADAFRLALRYNPRFAAAQQALDTIR